MKYKMEEMKCKRCGHTWFPRQASPKQCPKCKCYYWFEDREDKNRYSKKWPTTI